MAASVCVALAAAGCSVRPLVADPESLAAAPPELVDRLRAVLMEAVPPEPPRPSDGRKPWRWMNKML